MKIFSKLVLSLALLVGFVFVLVPANAGAVNVYSTCDGPDGIAGNADDLKTAVCTGREDSVGKLMKTIVDVAIYLVGTVSVIVVIVSGFIYTTSNGEPAQVKKAKDTLTYAIAGLVIAIMAYAIVNWIIKWVV